MSILRCELTESSVNHALAGLGLDGYEAVRYPTYFSHREKRGFFDTFRLKVTQEPHQNRDLMVYVFPFSDPEWEATIDQVFAFEQRAWTAWWRWAADCAFQLVQNPQDLLTVYPIPPLVQPAAEVIRPFTLAGPGGLSLKAFLRPMIEWPALDFQSLTTERSQELFRGEFGFQNACQKVFSNAGAGTALRGQSGQVLGGDDFGFDAQGFSKLCNSDQTCRKLLSNGHYIVPTQWRLFHSQFHKFRLGGAF
jgi:hypothetical protein